MEFQQSRRQATVDERSINAYTGAAPYIAYPHQLAPSARLNKCMPWLVSCTVATTFPSEVARPRHPRPIITRPAVGGPPCPPILALTVLHVCSQEILLSVIHSNTMGMGLRYSLVLPSSRQVPCLRPQTQALRVYNIRASSSPPK